MSHVVWLLMPTAIGKKTVHIGEALSQNYADSGLLAAQNLEKKRCRSE